MTKEQFVALKRGDIISARFIGPVMVDGHYGDHVTAIVTVDVTNPEEWELVATANYTPTKKD